MTLGDAIEHYLKSNKMYARFMAQEIIAAWPIVMGANIARHTVDLQMSRGVLSVRLNSAVLRKELDMGKEKIVLMLNEHVKMQVVNTVRFF
jgi:predicted nucleic acid-binding Zn ribbon protein